MTVSEEFRLEYGVAFHYLSESDPRIVWTTSLPDALKALEAARRYRFGHLMRLKARARGPTDVVAV